MLNKLLLVIVFMAILFTGCVSNQKLAEEKPEKEQRFVSTLSINPEGNIALGEPVDLNFIVKNTGVEDRSYYLLGNQKVVFEIFDSKKNKIWSSTQEESSKLQQFTFLALSTIDESILWDSKTSEGENIVIGRYMAKAYVPVADNMRGFSDSLFFNIVD